MKTSIILSMLLCLVFFSCSKEEPIQNEIPEPERLPLNEKVMKTFEAANFNTQDITSEILEHPDGSKEALYLVEGDIYINPVKLQNLVNNRENKEVHNRQYSTDELVDNNRTLKVLGYLSNYSSGLTYDMTVSLRWAISNYNALDMGLNFELTCERTSDFDDYDIVVYRYDNGVEGGSSGFPSNGDPYKWVRIYSGMDNHTKNTVEHVITHEIGHSVGLRHSDWVHRQSCGWNLGIGGETLDDGNGVHIGANFISGTHSAYDPNSIMLACFKDDEDGEFGHFDKVALETLY